MIFIKTGKYRIQYFRHPNGKEPFTEWLNSLDDRVILSIGARITRFENGHFGDCKNLGGGVFEARFFIGPGYRFYFAVHKDHVILLLTGGDKSTQQKDIRKAKSFFKEYMEVQNANKKS